MSIEQRIREGLGVNAADVSAPIEATLASVHRRHRRRVRVRVGAALAGIAVVAAAPWAAGTWLGSGQDVEPVVPDRPALPGSYEVDVEGHGNTRSMDGTWIVILRADGSVEIDPPVDYKGPLPSAGETYRLAGDELTTNLYVGWPGCQQTDPPVGRYRVATTTTGLTFEAIEDTCPPRVQLFGARWKRMP